MMRALFAGVSGLRNHQVRMDVIGNNIANVNTVAFKSSRVTFAESFNQLLQGATRPPANSGGRNPTQIGNGMNIASIDTKFTQGTIQGTGVKTDVAISGDAFFVVKGNGKTLYTRAGNFQFDANGRLVSPSNGFITQGINADPLGNFSSSSAVTDIDLTLNLKSPARATQNLSLAGNLNLNQRIIQTTPATISEPHQMSITVYDTAGQAHNLVMTFKQVFTGTPAAPDNTWTFSITSATGTVEGIDNAATPATGALDADQGLVTFNAQGQMVDFSNGVVQLSNEPVRIRVTPNSGGTPFDVVLDPGSINDINGLSQFANPSNAVFTAQDGYTSGDLQDISIDSTGVITGFYTNGVSRPVAQLSLASFNNPTALLRRGDNMYEPSANSGVPVLGFAGTSITSTITASALESSNVDLSEQFTEMITAQRGFQASARVITTSDEMLTELVNLKR
ncbi:MAG: flagellar hook protein FlgE [Gemmatimonadales bacterium]|nr:flagellar hook protein FlgE [Gemmatimonadales bacterium]